MSNQKITFTLRGQDYVIGTVTLRQYYEIYADIDKDDLDAHFAIASTLSGCDAKLLRELKADNWKMLWASIVGMLNSYFMQDIQQISQEFTFGGVKYGLVNMNDMTIGEFADLDVLANSDDLHLKYHKVLAILYRPIVKKNVFTKDIVPYSEINYAEQCEIFKDLPLQYVKSAISFFLRSANQSFENTVTYLLNLTEEMNLSQIESKALRSMALGLQETGGSLLTPLQLKTPRDFIKLPTLGSEKVLTGSRGNKTKLKKSEKQ